MRSVSELLDQAVAVPGTGFRVGVDPLLSVLPVGGDAAGAAISLYIVAEAARLGVSPETLAKMLLNVGLDATVGSVPVLGTVFDAVYKANVRNVRLAERELGAE